jgi:LuxR family maltose regulon positive regulatory protein
MESPAGTEVRELPTALRDAKFALPVLRGSWLRRAHIDARIGRAPLRDRVQVTVLAAPAGAGKTSALAALARGRDRRDTAWCTLDSEGEDAYRFGQSVLGSVLAARAAGGIDRLGAAACTARDPLDAAVELVAGADMLFVFDNVEFLAPAAIPETIGRLVRHLPSSASVVLLTKIEHDWADVFGARAVVRVLRETDLAFSPAETAALFARRGIDLLPDGIAALTTCTEGVAADVNLAAHAIARGDHVDAWLRTRDRRARVHLALARLPENARQFLVQISVSRFVTTGLAAAVTGCSEQIAAGTLAGLAADEGFLARVDGWPGAFRLDEYALSALRSEAKPEIIAQAYRRAAHWFADHGAAGEALRSAVAAGDCNLSIELIVNRWSRATLDAVPSGLPGLEGADITGAPIVDTILALNRDDIAAAKVHFAAIDRDNLPRNGALAVALMRYAIARTGREVDDIEDAAVELDKWAREAAAPSELVHKAQGTALRIRAETRIIEGDLTTAATLLHESGGLGVALGDDAMTVNATALAALVSALGGRVRRATALTDELGDTCVPVRSPAAEGVRALTLAICAYHDDRLGRAQEALLDARALVPAGFLADTVLPAVRARIAKSLGDDANAEGILLRAATAGRPRLLDVLREGLALRDGPRNASAAAPGDLQALMATHRYTLVTDDLERAVMFHAAGATDEMRGALERALGSIARNGYRRVCVDTQLPVQPVLAAYLAEDRPFRMLAAQLLERLDHVDRPEERVTVEALTERELAVLRYLPTMLSNREIAAEMFFSVNTVKTHLKGIYRKLDVNRRRDAVERARALSLI